MLVVFASVAVCDAELDVGCEFALDVLVLVPPVEPSINVIPIAARMIIATTAISMFLARCNLPAVFDVGSGVALVRFN